jgi:hypothetical protein
MKRVKAITVISLFIFSAIFLTSCLDEKKQKILGCTDFDSLSYNSDATIDDGSCTYSSVTFYARWNNFNYVPITRIEVLVNGEYMDTIPAIYYLNGPENCDAQGTVKYEFQNEERVNWSAIVYLADGAIVHNSGRVRPSSFARCMKINVTEGFEPLH